MKTVSEHSAGGVVLREGLWLISQHSGYHKWVLPKGIIETGETPEEAALREVFEETGIQGKIVKKIDYQVKYTYRKGDILVNKKVDFYLMNYVSGDTKDHSWEMEEAKWVDFREALEELGFEEEKKVLQLGNSEIKKS